MIRGLLFDLDGTLVDSATMNGLNTLAITSIGVATKSATFSTRCSAMRFGTSSPRTKET